jgi:hypothetical protein
LVKGLAIFRDHFAGFLNSYVLIGGTACDLAFTAVGQEFRATEDLDIVLVTENMTSAFATAFWEFVVAGDYEHRRKGEDGEMQFYRFIEPKTQDYPKQLELFSRKSDLLTSVATGALTRVPIGEEGSSLSAILLDEDYYSLIREQRTESEGVSCLPPVALIPLKAAAWLDLTRRKAEGGRVDSRDIRKHKPDVFRLFTLLTADTRLPVSPKVQASLRDFIEEMKKATPNLKDLGIRGISLDEIFTTLGQIYGL